LAAGETFSLDLTAIDLPESFCSYKIVLDEDLNNNYFKATFNVEAIDALGFLTINGVETPLKDVQLSELYSGQSKFVVVGDVGSLFSAKITVTMANNLEEITMIVLIIIGCTSGMVLLLLLLLFL
jgi:hypothetical protein